MWCLIMIVWFIICWWETSQSIYGRGGEPLCLTCSEATLVPLHNLCPREAVCECSWSCWVSVQYLVKNKKDCNKPVCVEVF